MESSHTTNVWIALVITVVLVLINGMLASAEIAFMGLKEPLLKKKSAEGDRKAETLLGMKRNPSAFLSTIQIGITLAGLLSGAFAADSLAAPIVSWAASLGAAGIALSVIRTVSVILITLIMTFFMLVFGELVPKRIAMVRPEKTAYLVVNIISALSKIAKPLVKLLSLSTNGVLRLLRINPSDESSPVTEEEILMMVQEGTEQGTIEGTEAQFVSNSFAFSDLTVEDVMTHRTELSAIPEDATVRDAVETMARTRHTRYPVYKDTIDGVVGILYIRDLYELYPFKEQPMPLPLVRDIMRPPFFVSETKLLSQLFDEMKDRQNQMAVVVDEYGGTSGVITVMDIVEEVVGEFEKRGQYEIRKTDDGVFLLNGLMKMEDAAAYFSLGVEFNRNETVSGYLINTLGYIPGPDQHPETLIGNYLFRVEKSEGALIRQVRVIPGEPDQETGPSEAGSETW
ncbi:hemolysin family protein [Breznakiella homolactica]|uniref:HlyC/CorC family transporter n=1 Tax=Breznakiella homolactica TaxID=2798577 RepID=A0A7T7XR83_9SPIR|nr:hemolysin family protein [Breznakiella homolactica]QQO10988.1 hemolysin family protein [Breznakiella homolactica]